MRGKTKWAYVLAPVLGLAIVGCDVDVDDNDAREPDVRIEDRTPDIKSDVRIEDRRPDVRIEDRRPEVIEERSNTDVDVNVEERNAPADSETDSRIEGQIEVEQR